MAGRTWAFPDTHVPCATPEWVDDQRKDDEQRAGPTARVRFGGKCEPPPVDALPQEYQSRGEGERGEERGERIDPRKEVEVVRESHPQPQRHQQGGNGRAREGAGCEQQRDDRQGKSKQDGLYRPEELVVGTKDAKEPNGIEGNIHGPSCECQQPAEAGGRLPKKPIDSRFLSAGDYHCPVPQG